MVLILFFIFVSNLWAESKTRYVDGKIEFATATVNGKVCWTIAEKDTEISKYDVQTATFPLQVVYYNASQYELWAATASGKLTNYSDFKNLLNDKDVLFEKMKIIKAEKDLYDLIGNSIKSDKNKQKFDSLKEIYNSLP